MKLEGQARQFAALGHVARLSLLRAVVAAGTGGISMTDLQARLDIPWTTLNHHLGRLVQAGFVVARREGRFVYHTADRDALHAIGAFLWEDCCKHGKASAKR